MVGASGFELGACLKFRMKIPLNPETERLIAGKVQSGRYRSADEVIREGLELLQAQETPAGRSEKTSQSVTDVFASIAEEVPDKEWAGVPSDLSKNADHYLYGSPANPDEASFRRHELLDCLAQSALPFAPSFTFELARKLPDSMQTTLVKLVCWAYSRS
jgi:putative addiction module CopG family antidote